MIKAVFLDVDDTILDFKECSEIAMKKTCEKFGIEFSETFANNFFKVNDVIWSKIEKGTFKKSDMYKVRYDTVFEMTGLAKGNGEAFDNAYRQVLGDEVVLIDGAGELIKYLSDKYTLCIASNASSFQQKRRLERAGFAALVDYMFVPDIIGHEKPRKEFFDECFKRLGDIKPSETVMIGDSLNADIVGAKNYGIKCIWFNRDFSDKTKTNADYTVGSLREIMNII